MLEPKKENYQMKHSSIIKIQLIDTKKLTLMIKAFRVPRQNNIWVKD